MRPLRVIRYVYAMAVGCLLGLLLFEAARRGDPIDTGYAVFGTVLGVLAVACWTAEGPARVVYLRPVIR